MPVSRHHLCLRANECGKRSTSHSQRLAIILHEKSAEPGQPYMVSAEVFRLRMQARATFATAGAPKFRVDCLGGFHGHGTIEAPQGRRFVLGKCMHVVMGSGETW